MNVALRTALIGLCFFPLACSDVSGDQLDASAPDAATGTDASAADASVADARGDDAGVGSCPLPTGGPTVHLATTINTSTVWRAADSPHRILGDFTVGRMGSLTIEPCSEIRLRNGAYFIIQGELVARGEMGRPITFHADAAGTRFNAIWTRNPIRADLAWVEIEEGGETPGQTHGASLIVEGGGFPPMPGVNVEHVQIKNSGGLGVWLRSYASFAATSQDLTIVGSGQIAPQYPYPVRISMNAMGTLPSGSYTGNLRDEIQLVGEAPHYGVELDDALHDRGVPYHIGGNGAAGLITVHGTSQVATLTIDPGVIMKFESTRASVGGFFVGGPVNDPMPSGRVIAAGTTAAQIVFTSTFTVGAPGDWEGVTFTGPIDPGNRLEHVRIEFAGAHGGDSGFGCPPNGQFSTDGALKIFNLPGSEFMTNSTIAHASTHGVYRAWVGGPVDFIATNSFEDIVGCLQVEPKPPMGACPMNPSCPR